MIATGHISHLKRVAQARGAEVENWKEGIFLEKTLSCPVQDMLRQAAAARWRLARKHRSEANKLLAFHPPQYRSAISRLYYSMYHAMRACAFLFYEGDDHEDHSKLPLHIPQDFPNKSWQQTLKDARLARNIADYEPYPMGNGWRRQALALHSQADQLIIEAKTYLTNKGCKL